MKDKRSARLRRATRTRAKIKSLKQPRLCVYRSGQHIYAQIIDDAAAKVLTQASTVEPELRGALSKGSNCEAATHVGKRLAEKAVAAGIEAVAFDRSGYKYHGRVKALAEAARANGLKF